VLARKPLAGTVAANVQAHGTGALNIDGCRAAVGQPDGRTRDRSGETTKSMGYSATGGTDFRAAPGPRGGSELGRWPANVVLVHADTCTDRCARGCPVAELDQQSGVLTSGANPTRRSADKFRDAYGEFAGQAECTPARGADAGGASRFFPSFRWEAKAPTSERPQVHGVSHPTVKPVDLMRWLVRLVCPPDGLVLDPFAGSGTTLQAARAEGMRAVGIEREPSYLPLIRARLDARARTDTPPAAAAAGVVDDGPMDLFDLLDGEAS
jgi:hypothetical protein